MKGKEKITKTELVLLGMTAVFLCVLLGLSRQTRETPETETSVPQEEVVPAFEPVDLNTATAEELAELPGIGEELAGRIVDYRTANGPFESVEELMEVRGIGEVKFAELEDRITVEKGETP